MLIHSKKKKSKTQSDMVITDPFQFEEETMIDSTYQSANLELISRYSSVT
jgi:hypothetical protein